MNLSHQFQVTTGVTAGQYHRTSGSLGNCQDAVRATSMDNLIIGVVSDGCGSAPHSQCGAILTVGVLPKRIKELYTPDKKLDQNWFDHLLALLVEDLTDAARKFDGNLTDVLNSHMMATAGGVIVGEETTYVFGAGDFFYSDGGDMQVWKPAEGNYPAYPLYKDARFKVATYPTRTLNRFFMGTDGVEDLLQACEDPDEMIPGTDTPVGPFDQIWTTDAFYDLPSEETEPTPLDTWLNSLATTVRQPGPPHHTGLLGDDTALFVLRRWQQDQDKEPENS